jgi:hypothetical protein
LFISAGGSHTEPDELIPNANQTVYLLQTQQFKKKRVRKVLNKAK